MGVLGIVAGVVTFAWPGLTALSLLYLVAFWAIATGTFQVIAAIALRRELDNEFWMALGGVASIVFGVLLVAFPGEGLISLVWLVGLWSVVFGVSSLSLAYRLHKIDAAQADSRGGALTSRRPSSARAARRRTAAWTRHESGEERRQRRSSRFETRPQTSASAAAWTCGWPRRPDVAVGDQRRPWLPLLVLMAVRYPDRRRPAR